MIKLTSILTKLLTLDIYVTWNESKNLQLRESPITLSCPSFKRVSLNGLKMILKLLIRWAKLRIIVAFKHHLWFSIPRTLVSLSLERNLRLSYLCRS